jgi:hypothetical protein
LAIDPESAARGDEYSETVAAVIDVLTAVAGAGRARPGRGISGRCAPENAKPLHGNNLRTTKPAQGYTLRNRDTGAVLKYGETTLGKGRYSAKYLREHNAEMVFEKWGTKAEMHQWQHEQILEYKRTHGGQRPPLNKNDY